MAPDWTKPLFIVSTTSAAFLAGAYAGSSAMAVPALLARESTPSKRASTSRLLSEWTTLYTAGRDFVVPVALVSMVSSFGAAYTHYHPQVPRQSYCFALAGITTIAAIPFTILAMGPVINELHDMDEDSEEIRTEELDLARRPQAIEAVQKWQFLNTIRTFFPLVGALLAFEAL